MKGVVKGVVIVDAAGEVKEAGRAGTEGGVVEEDDPVLVEVEVVLSTVGAGEEVLAAGTDVDAAAAAAMVPLRSHGFGGEPIDQIRPVVDITEEDQVCESGSGRSEKICKGASYEILVVVRERELEMKSRVPPRDPRGYFEELKS